jgi:hypothetical protein
LPPQELRVLGVQAGFQGAKQLDLHGDFYLTANQVACGTFPCSLTFLTFDMVL